MKKEFITVNCAYCHKDFEMRYKIYKDAEYHGHHNHYCSKECQHKQATSTRVTCICENCGKEFTKPLCEYKSSTHHYCSRACAHKKINHSRIITEEQKLQISNTLKNKRYKKICKKCGKEFEAKGVTAKYCYYCTSSANRNKICNICGLPISQCEDRKLCLKLNKSLEYFKHVAELFNYTLHLGTTEIYNDYKNLYNILYDLYYNKHLSIPELEKQYGFKRGFYVLKFFGIPRRSFIDASHIAIKENRWYIPANDHPYKTEHHKTWNGKDVFLRSSYETDFANELDQKQINYEVEAFHIEYFDSLQNKIRVAIPDFYLPDTNEIIEIKGLYTFNEQNMIDKFKKYKELGYNPKLILEHKEKILKF